MKRFWLGLLLGAVWPAFADSTVVFNEIMFHPRDGNEALQWIELHNQMAVDVDLSGWKLEGAGYSFAEGTVLAGGGYLVIARNVPAFRAANGATNVLGPFTGSLDQGGEHLRLVNHNGRIMDEMTYGDEPPWPVGADGSGASLAKRHPQYGSANPTNWMASYLIGGTPGSNNVAKAGTVVIPSLALNEIAGATNTSFQIELLNCGNTTAGLAGLVLWTTTGGAPEYRFAAGSLEPGARLALDETQLNFHPQAEDRLFLCTSNQQRLIDAAAVKNRPRARWPEGTGPWLHPDAATFGGANRFALRDEIVINEIMYHHGGSYTAQKQLVESSEQWVELYNRAAYPVELTNWRLDGDIHFDFAAGTQLPAGGYLVIARDAAALRTNYPAIAIVGNFSGRLSGASSRLVLKDSNDNPADEVTYWSGGRWPERADGGGSSLELTDPRADNNCAEAWAASDESGRSPWRTYTIRGIATSNPNYNIGSDIWKELVLGFLDAGEALLDDISVIELPAGTARQLIQNSTFETDAIGSQPAKWRVVGSHGAHGRTRVETDPDNAANHVLRLAATGTTDVNHNHAETTLKAGGSYVSVVAGREYAISFRAKWLGGSRLLNSRLYFNWLQTTTVLEASDHSGTPGAANSRAVANLGPTWANFQHSPPVPKATSNVTVTVLANDPDGVASVTLYYAVNGGAWKNLPMPAGASGVYQAVIPGQAAGAKVQFYTRGVDARGAVSTYPAGGAQSRAIYIVDDGRANLAKLHNLRFVMTDADRDFLYYDTNRLSNDRLGATLIYDESEVFYDVGVRLKASSWGRTHDTETGFNLEFDPDRPFRGIHPTLGIERGGSKREVLAHHLFNRAGRGIAGGYDDVAWIITPRSADVGVGLFATTRTGRRFLDEQYPGAEDGSVYNYEVLYTPTTTVNGNPEAPKLNFPYDNQIGGGPDIQDLGDDPEYYRWNFQLRNQHDRDDFSPIVALGKAFDLNGAALEARASEVMDVDQWLRHFAMESILGKADFYTRLWNHNLRFYQRSSDNRLVCLPWDLDGICSLDVRAPMWGVTGVYGQTNRMRKVIEWPPHLRRFYGHMLDLIQTTCNRDYATRWGNHYTSLTGEGMSGYVDFIAQRGAYILSQLPAPVPFAITSINGGRLEVTNSTFTVSGLGWIDLRKLRLIETGDTLEVAWTGLDTWQVSLPAEYGTNTFTLEAVSFDGAVIGRQQFAVFGATSSHPQRDWLRVTEIMYHPEPFAGLYPADEFEYVELRNLGPDSLDLNGVRFTNGITFDFTGGAITNLGPGERVLVVKNAAAFAARWPATELKIAGAYPDQLGNNGETLALVDRAGILIQNFSYAADWYPLTDGLGFSLVIVDESSPLPAWGEKSGWRVSAARGGSPGAADPLPNFPRVLVNEVLARPVAPALDAVELYNASTNEVDLGGWFLTDDPATPKKYRIPDGTVITSNGFFVFDESQFNPPGSPAAFAFGAKGDQAFLYSGDAMTNLTGYSHGFAFGASALGVSFGRHVTSTGDEHFTPQLALTLGASNAGPRVGPVVINEIHYHPAAGGEEFVELKNITASPVKLYDPARPGNTWRLAGLNYAFPTNVEIPAGGLLVLCATNAAAFRAAYQVPASVPVLGPTGGALQDSGEELELQRPDEAPGTVVFLEVEKVRYNDRAPWPVAADGSGPSLQRVNAAVYGNDPAHWRAAILSPGRDWAGGTPPTILAPPADVNAAPGADVLFSVTTSGSPPLRCQWHYGADPIPGATNSVLRLTAVRSDQAGSYQVVVFNNAGAVQSPPAWLSVPIPPSILRQPQDQAVKLGEDAVFSVIAVANQPLTYQWRFNGTNLPGQTGATLAIDNCQLEQNGEYTVAISNGASTALSDPARLLVLVTPVIIQPPLSQSVVVGGDVTLSVTITGSPAPFGYIWRRGVVNLTNIVTDRTNCFFTLRNVQTSQGGSSVTYRVIVTNAALTAISVNATFNLTVLSDNDGDGLPDTWETAAGLNPNSNADRNLDRDGDGMTNWQEYIAGTDPANPLSYLRILRLVPGTTTVEFMAVSNKTYSVEFRDSASEGIWTRLADVPAQTKNHLQQVTDSASATNRFYRLLTPRQP